MNNPIKKVALALLAVCGISLSVTASAAGPVVTVAPEGTSVSYTPPESASPEVRAIANSTENIMALMLHLFQNPSPAYMQTFDKTLSHINTVGAIQANQNLSQQTSSDVQNFVYTSMSTPIQNQAQAASIPFINTKNINNKLPKRTAPGVYAQLLPLINTNTAYSNSEAFSAGSLLNTDNLSSPTQQAMANNFIQFIGDYAGRITPVPLPVLAAGNNTQLMDYLNSLGTYYAGQSVGLNVLYYLYNERLPVKSLNNDSMLSYAKKAATARMNTQWASNVTTMSTVDLQREQVLMQAQMLNEMYQMRMQLEMLNSTLAVMQLQSQQNVGKTILLTKQQFAIQTANSSTGAGDGQ